MKVPRGVMNPVYPLLLLLVGVSILPFTAVAAEGVQHEGSVTEAGLGEQAVESNATAAITGVTVNESVFHAGDTTSVWKAGQNGSDATVQRIDVALSAGVSGDHEVCLDQGSTACGRVQEQAGTQTVSFTNVSLPANRTTITVSLHQTSDGVRVDNATLSVWRIDRDGDLDRDGLSNERETAAGTSLILGDTDGDGLVDDRELTLGTDPTATDTDGDGLDDEREVDVGSNPTVVDTDDDGLADAREVKLGTDPTVVDTDSDGLADAREVGLDTDPTAADTDDDGLADGREVGLGANPLAADTDGDGLADAREVEAGTGPTVGDTDGDYLSDGTEAELGFDPTNTYTPALYGSGLVGFLLGIGVAVSAIEDGPVAWLRSRVSTTPGQGATADSSTDADAPVADPVPVILDDTDGPDDGSTARDIFERHQDALVTDAERTLRMLEAEGGQMKQSTIVDSTSWSKAKVSRLLSRMDDDSEIVKVPIGRENLICLPDEAPDPAQPTDSGAVSSTPLVSTATGG